MIVHSDKRKTPRYWVTLKDEVVSSSESANEAIQWAINHASKIRLSSGVFEVDFPLPKLKDDTIISGETTK